jgi:hypothetical protein
MFAMTGCQTGWSQDYSISEVTVAVVPDPVCSWIFAIQAGCAHGVPELHTQLYTGSGMTATVELLESLFEIKLYMSYRGLGIIGPQVTSLFGNDAVLLLIYDFNL